MGFENVDIDVKIRVCGDVPSALIYDLRREQAGNTSKRSLTESEFDALVGAATTLADFDAMASSILGSWYDTLPEGPGNQGKTGFFNQMSQDPYHHLTRSGTSRASSAPTRRV